MSSTNLMDSSTEKEVQDKYKAAERELKQDLQAKYFSDKNLSETGTVFDVATKVDEQWTIFASSEPPLKKFLKTERVRPDLIPYLPE